MLPSVTSKEEMKKGTASANYCTSNNSQDKRIIVKPPWEMR